MVLPLTRRGQALIAAYTIIPVVATIMFALRLYVQLRLINRLKSWENLAAGLAWLSFMGYSSILITSAFHGVGYHLYEVPFTEFKTLLIIAWLSEVFYLLTNLATKQSIALTLLRYATENHRTIVIAVTSVMQTCGVIMGFMMVLQCVPTSYFWTRIEESNGKCINLKILVIAGYIYSAVTIVYDVTMAALPWFIVRTLRLDIRTRVMVAIILALASIASVATIIRLPFLIRMNNEADYLFDGAKIAILSCIETGLSIIASSAATFRPLFRKIAQNNHSTSIPIPALNSISVGSSHPSCETKIGDIEFSTAFYDTIRDLKDSH